jgi:ATP-dependent Zn protease
VKMKTKKEWESEEKGRESWPWVRVGEGYKNKIMKEAEMERAWERRKTRRKKREVTKTNLTDRKLLQKGNYKRNTKAKINKIVFSIIFQILPLQICFLFLFFFSWCFSRFYRFRFNFSGSVKKMKETIFFILGWGKLMLWVRKSNT